MSTFEAEVVQPALADLNPFVIGREVLAFAALPSTNLTLREHAERGAAEGLLAIADEQTAGRGRRGRSWSAPAGTNLLVSMLLRPTWLPATDAFWLTIMAAVALRDAIIQATGVTTQFKWPNDLLYQDKKLAGILVECETFSPESLRWAIIGCGTNANWYPADDPALQASTTSLAAITGKPIERSALLRALIVSFDQQYMALRSGRREQLRERWLRDLVTLGQSVQVEISATQTFHGIAESVDSDGALRIRLPDGSQRRVLAGDVRVRHSQPTGDSQ